MLFTAQELEAERAYVATLLKRRLRSREAVEDLTQDVLVKAWSCRESYRGEADLRTWLYRVTVNELHDERRRRWKRQRDVLLDSLQENSDWLLSRDPGPERVVLGREELRRVLRLLRREKHAGLVLVLALAEGVPQVELMQRYGIAEGTVKSRASRVRERVRVGLG